MYWQLSLSAGESSCEGRLFKNELAGGDELGVVVVDDAGLPAAENMGEVVERDDRVLEVVSRLLKVGRGKEKLGRRYVGKDGRFLDIAIRGGLLEKSL